MKKVAYLMDADKIWETCKINYIEKRNIMNIKIVKRNHNVIELFKLKKISLDNTFPGNITDIKIVDAYMDVTDIEHLLIVSDADEIYLNEDSNNLFNECNSLYFDIDISDIFKLNPKYVESANRMFKSCHHLNNLEFMKYWKFENLMSLDGMFYCCISLENIYSMPKNLVTKKVTSLREIFNCCYALTSIAPLSNWDITNVKDMHCIFSYCKSLFDFDAIKFWDTSNMRDMFKSFCGTSIENLNFMKNWKFNEYFDYAFGTSRKITFSYTFSECYNLKDISALKGKIYLLKGEEPFKKCIKLKDNEIVPMKCPEQGEFIGYKVAASESISDKFIVIKLLIPKDALRSSDGFSNKCRCDKCKVLDMWRVEDNNKKSYNGVAVSAYSQNSYHNPVKYKIGKMIFADQWDDCRWNQCSSGIHFFMTEKEALSYLVN